MSESRICPVCEKKMIPDDDGFLCPNCKFELKWLDDVGEIERAKQSFTGELFNDSEQPQEEPSPSILGHCKTGVYGDIFFTIVFLAIFPGDDWWHYLGDFLYGLPGGLLAGFIGYLLEKNFNKPFRKRKGFFLVTILISIILSTITSCFLYIGCFCCW